MPPEHRLPARLRDMEIHAERALAYVAGMGAQDFLANTLVQDAVLRCFDVLGEAARTVPPEDRARLSAIPWAAVIGMRNRLVHEYRRVDVMLVYRTVCDDLPGLLQAIRSILPVVNTDAPPL